MAEIVRPSPRQQPNVDPRSDAFWQSAVELSRRASARFRQLEREEVAGDALLKAVRNRDRVENADYPHAFMATIVMNTALSALRTHRRRTPPIQLEPFHVIPERSPSAEDALIARQGLHRVLDAIARLAPQARRVFRRIAIDGASAEVVAFEEGLQRDNVNQIMHRSRLRIRSAVLKSHTTGREQTTPASSRKA